MITWLSTKSPIEMLDDSLERIIARRETLNRREIHTPSFSLKETDAQYFSHVPPACLKVLKLLHHEKMTFAEITRQTGWPHGTVCSRIYRARTIIRQMRLADQPPETMQAPTLGMVGKGKSEEPGQDGTFGGFGANPRGERQV